MSAPTRPDHDRTPGPRTSVFVGAGAAGALAAIGLAVAALVGRPPVTSLPGVSTTILFWAIAALLVAVVTLACLGAVVRARATETIAGVIGLVALVGVPAAGYAAVALAADGEVLPVVDSASTALTASLAVAIAVLGSGCAAVAASAATEDAAVPRWSRIPAHAANAAIAVLMVVAAVVATLVVPAQAKTRLIAQESPVVETPRLPTGVDETAFRVRSDHSDQRVFAAGPGFVVTDSDTVTARDGRTGAVRWEFDRTVLGTGRGGVTVVGTGSAAVVVVSGTIATVGIDPMTGRVRWRTAAPERKAAAYWLDDDDGLVVLDPRTGGVSTLPIGCDTPIAVGSVHIVRADCTAPDRYLITDRTTGVDRAFEITAPVGRGLDSIVHLGDEVFAVEFEPAESRRGRISEDLMHTTVIVDAAVGEVIDRFDREAYASSTIRNGRIVWPISTDSTDPAPRIGVRDVTAHRTTVIAVPGYEGTRQHFGSAWVGDRLVLLGYDAAFLVAPDGTTRRLPPVCTAGSGDDPSYDEVVTVPGAVVVACSAPDSASYDTEIVGLR